MFPNGIAEEDELGAFRVVPMAGCGRRVGRRVLATVLRRLSPLDPEAPVTGDRPPIAWRARKDQAGAGLARRTADVRDRRAVPPSTCACAAAA